MFWNEPKPKELKFDLDKLSSMKNEVKNDAEEIAKLKNELLQKMEILKGDWNTYAGRTFMDKIDQNWAKEVDRFVVYLRAVEELLETAEQNYREVEEVADRLTF